MSSHLISSRVEKLVNISERVKQFVHDKAHNNEGNPFVRVELQKFGLETKVRAKRSLSDWRQLYPKSSKKILPNNQENQEFQILNNAQSNIHRKRSSKHRNYINRTELFTPDKYEREKIATRTTLRQKFSDKKREILLGFALAQNCLEHQILKQKRAQTAKVKRYYESRNSYEKQSEYLSFGKFMQNSEQKDIKTEIQGNTEEKLIQVLHFEDIIIKPFNKVKIMEKSKINNSMLMAKIDHLKESRKQIFSQKGLRYYSRA